MAVYGIVVRAGYGGRSPEIHATPPARFESGLGKRSLRLHSVGPAPDWKDGQDLGRFSRHVGIRAHLVVSVVTVVTGATVFISVVWWPGGTIQNVDCVLHKMRPKDHRTVACLACGSDDLHDGSYGPFRHTVELVDMWWASCAVD